MERENPVLDAIDEVLECGPVTRESALDYLACEKRYTLHSWLKRRLRGGAFSYLGRYYEQLDHAMRQLHRRGIVDTVRSEHGKLAYAVSKPLAALLAAWRAAPDGQKPQIEEQIRSLVRLMRQEVGYGR